MVKNRNDPYMTGAIKGLNWVKTMRYVRSPLPSLFMVGAAYLEVPVFLVRPVSLGYITINILTAKVWENAAKASILVSRTMTGASGGKAL